MVKNLIDQEAKRLNKSRTDFILQATCLEAENGLADQVHFSLDEEIFSKFQLLLNSPLKPNKGLDKLLSAKSPWE